MCTFRHSTDGETERSYTENAHYQRIIFAQAQPERRQIVRNMAFSRLKTERTYRNSLETHIAHCAHFINMYSMYMYINVQRM